MEQMFQDFGGIGGIMGQRKMLEDFPSRFEELPLSDRPDSGGQTDRDLMLKSDSGIRKNNTQIYNNTLYIYQIKVSQPNFVQSSEKKK